MSANSQAADSSTNGTPRPLNNAVIGQKLAELSQLVRASGENPFKARAYRRAAETISQWPDSVAAMVDNGEDLTAIPAVGAGIAAVLRELVITGEISQKAKLAAKVPPEMLAVTQFPGLDPRRLARIFKKLGVLTVDEIQQALEAGTIKSTFGQGMEDDLRAALRKKVLLLLYDADQLAQRIGTYLTQRCGVERVLAAGDLRRRVEVIDELVFLVAAPDFTKTLLAFGQFGGGLEQLKSESEATTFQLPGSLPVTLRRAPLEHWGLASLEATGSPAHLRALAQRAAVRVREREPAASDEAAVYRSAGLAWIPPELREGEDEIELAARGQLPALIALKDIRGDLHTHTVASDGVNSIAEMAEAAQARGYEYLAITDHSQSLKIAHGVPADELWRQIRRIDRLNAKLNGFRVLKSAEVDILADGSLDYPPDLLAELDLTVCSIHSRFRLNRNEQTGRILRAMDNPAFTIMGHATGRILLKRTGYDFDLEKVIAHAKAVGCSFEINADPDRLDLSTDHVRQVVAAGVKIAINTDAHRVSGLEFMICGVDVARRAGVERAMVLNTLSWPELQRTIRRIPDPGRWQTSNAARAMTSPGQ